MGRYANRDEDHLMSKNPDEYYGRDLACISDADELFSEASGIAVVVQDAIHRITTDHILGTNGIDWGYDCRRLLGAKQRELTLAQPTIAEALTRDDRIESADVTLTQVTTDGLIDATLDVTLYTAFGPFSFTTALSEITTLDLEQLV